MQEILKRTPDDHTDFVNLKLATEQMVKAGAAVNEKKREQEEREKKDRQDELGKKISTVNPRLEVDLVLL